MNRQECAMRKQKMIEMRESGMKCPEIAAHFGISQQRAWDILYRPTMTDFKLKEPKHQPAPNITVYEVLKIAEKIKAETGRYPSYGKVVAGIENGSIDPWRYIRRKRRAV